MTEGKIGWRSGGKGRGVAKGPNASPVCRFLIMNDNGCDSDIRTNLISDLSAVLCHCN